MYYTSFINLLISTRIELKVLLLQTIREKLVIKFIEKYLYASISVEIS